MLLSTSRPSPPAAITQQVSLEKIDVSAFKESLLRQPLFMRIVLPVLLVTALVSACLYPFYLALAESRMALATERRSAATADLLAMSLASPLEQGDMVQVRRILGSLARDSQVEGVKLLGTQDEVIAAFPEEGGKWLEDALASDMGTAVFDGRYVSWRPVQVNGSEVGRLYLSLKLPIERVRATMLMFVVGLGLAWTAAVTLVFLWAGRRWMEQPLEARVEGVRSGNGVDEILQALQNPVLLFDENGNVDEANPAALELLGVDAAELAGTPIDELIDFPRQQGRGSDTLADLATIKGGECQFNRRDGQPVPMVFSASTQGEGEDARLLLVAHDLTQRVRQEDYLRETAANAEKANRAKSGFLAKMSHELRTPLNAILGFAQIQKARLRPDAPDYLVKNTEHTLSAGWHLLNLINDVLDIARIEEDKLPLSIEECKLGEVVSHSRSLILADAELSGVTVEVQDSPLLVQADYTRLKQVFVNLFNNAIKYNHRGGKVSFRAVQLENGMVQCQVIDTGVGISAADTEKIFQPFTRLKYAEQNEIQGTGIGLALTRLLVELMGGRIHFTSEQGRGATFYVELPPGSKAAPASTPSQAGAGEDSSREAAKALMIYYVEDNPASLELMKAIMDPLPDVTLLTATTAEEGIELAGKHRPDLMIFDINLPGQLDGIAACREIRASAELGQVPLIALSADATEDSIEAAMEAGFDDYLTKPLDISKLMRLVEALPSGQGMPPSGY